MCLTAWHSHTRMSFYILKTKEFANSKDPKRVLYLMKRGSVPEEDRKHIISLKCSSVQKVKELSELMAYLAVNTADSSHEIQPYIIKQITWTEAVLAFGVDNDTETSDSSD